jgi:hypothetical protein
MPPRALSARSRIVLRLRCVLCGKQSSPHHESHQEHRAHGAGLLFPPCILCALRQTILVSSRKPPRAPSTRSGIAFFSVYFVCSVANNPRLIQLKPPRTPSAPSRIVLLRVLCVLCGKQSSPHPIKATENTERTEQNCFSPYTLCALRQTILTSSRKPPRTPSTRSRIVYSSCTLCALRQTILASSRKPPRTPSTRSRIVYSSCTLCALRQTILASSRKPPRTPSTRSGIVLLRVLGVLCGKQSSPRHESHREHRAHGAELFFSVYSVCSVANNPSISSSAGTKTLLILKSNVSS